MGDFGLSSFAEKTQDDAAGPTGTIAYMAPEVFEGLAYTTKADVSIVATWRDYPRPPIVYNRSESCQQCDLTVCYRYIVTE